MFTECCRLTDFAHGFLGVVWCLDIYGRRGSMELSMCDAKLMKAGADTGTLSLLDQSVQQGLQLKH